MVNTNFIVVIISLILTIGLSVMLLLDYLLICGWEITLTLRQHSCITIFKSMKTLIFFGIATAMSWYISFQSFTESTSTAFDALLMM